MEKVQLSGVVYYAIPYLKVKLIVFDRNTVAIARR